MTDKKTEALKLALEALEHMCMHTRAKVGYRNKLIGEAMDKAREALAEQPAPPPECKTDAEKTAFAFGWWKALEENRKQPAQDKEPCGWRMKHNGEWAYSFTKDAWDFIYAVSPAARKAARDNAPASKPWVGIDAGDWNKIAYTSEFRAGADWAEAKLREKNA